MGNGRKTIRSSAKLIVYLCSLIYFCSYILRLNFTVMLVKICSDMNLEKSMAAIVVTCLSVSYGLGQIVSGALGDKYKPQTIIGLGTTAAIACNILLYFADTIWGMAVIWTVNGFAHSLMWPPILKIFTVYLNDEEYSFGVVRVSWGSSIASILLYLLCPFLLQWLTWRQIILCCAGVGMAVLLVWLTMGAKVLSETPPLVEKIGLQTDSTEVPAALKWPKSIYIPIALIMLGIVLQGILRDGVTNWMPSFLQETFHIPEENAIVYTVILAVFSIISFGLFDWVNMRWFKNEVTCAAFIYGLATVFAIGLYVVNRFFSSALLSILFMALIVFCMHGINLMLIGIVPKHFAKTNKVSTFSGILNSCTYLGASASTYVFAALAEKYGWNITMFTWILICALGLVVCKGVVLLGWTKKYKKWLTD